MLALGHVPRMVHDASGCLFALGPKEPKVDLQLTKVALCGFDFGLKEVLETKIPSVCQASRACSAAPQRVGGRETRDEWFPRQSEVNRTNSKLGVMRAL